MKKNNARTTAKKQARQGAAKARRARRKARFNDALFRRLRPILGQLGAAQAQVNKLTKEAQRNDAGGSEAGQQEQT